MADDKIGIKGLSERVQAARSAINKARNASHNLTEAAESFANDADTITEEIKKHHDDLKFEANTLGNYGGPSASDGSEFPKADDAK